MSDDAYALVIDDVSLRFGGLAALEDVSFEVAAGEVVGLMGPNGAGKTSLLNCITGFYRASSGSITALGRPIHALPTHEIAKAGVARTFQTAANITGMGVRDVMMLGCQGELPPGVLRYALPSRAVARREADAVEQVLQVAETLGIADAVARNTPFDGLPYGVRKRADLGRALVASARLLLLDEPAAGLTGDEKRAMVATIERIASRPGITLMLVEHDISFMASLCARLVVLHGGRKIADGPTDTVLHDPVVLESYVGTTAKA